MPESRFVYTQHAEDMLGERNLRREWVELTVEQPESIETDPIRPDVIRAFRSIPERGGRVLRVAYVVVGQTVRVVTMFFDRKRRRQTPA